MPAPCTRRGFVPPLPGVITAETKTDVALHALVTSDEAVASMAAYNAALYADESRAQRPTIGDHVGSLPTGVGAPIDVDIDGNVGGPFDGPFQRVYYDGAVLKCVGDKRIQLIPPTPEGRAKSVSASGTILAM